MMVITNGTKATQARNTAKGLAKHPAALRAGAKAAPTSAKLAYNAGKPLVKRRVRQHADQIGDAAGRFAEAATALGTALATYGPEAATQLGLLEPPPKPKRTAPRIAVGVVLGASAVFFLDPEHGRQRRQQVLDLFS